MPDLQAVAERIARASRDARPVDPPSASGSELDEVDAYRVQELVAAELGADDSPVCGYKVAMFGATWFGRIRRRDVVRHGDSIPVAGLLQPRVEPELMFVLGAGLSGPDVLYTDVLRATDFVVPSIEVIVNRFPPDVRPERTDVIATNSSFGRAVIGGRPAGVDELDLADIPVTLTCDGGPPRRGGTDRPAVSPVHAVMGLAAALHRIGDELRPGDVVMTGSCTEPLPVEAGNTVTASFESLGSVRVSFSG